MKKIDLIRAVVELKSRELVNKEESYDLIEKVMKDKQHYGGGSEYQGSEEEVPGLDIPRRPKGKRKYVKSGKYKKDQGGSRQQQPWTDGEYKFLEEKLPILSNSIIAKSLGRTEKSIERKVTILGLKKYKKIGRPKEEFTRQDMSDVIS